MAVGRISGPLLKANLLRNGVDLAFETDLLYLDVQGNGRIGIHTKTPTHDLQVVGTTRTTNLEVTTQADIATFTINSNTIASSNGTINLEPSGTNPVVYQGKIVTGDLQFSTNVIETTAPDQDLEIRTLGTGEVKIYSNVYVEGDLHVTGTITADGDVHGNITIGDSNDDNVIFKADVNSDIIPNINTTYDLGSNPDTGGKEWRTAYTHNLTTTNIISDTAVVNGIDLVLPQGNTYYVAVNGSNTNSGVHEHAPVETIKHALSIAAPNDTVYVYPGIYEEILPLEIPAGVTLKGAGLRSVTVKPTAATRYLDMFHMNGEATLEDFTLSGFYHNPTGTYPEFPDDTENGTGHGVRFSYGCLTQTRSPYIRNISVLTRGTPSVLSVDSIKTEVIGSLNRIKSLLPDIVQNNAVTATSSNTELQDTSLPASDATTGTALQGLIDTVVYVINNGTLRTSAPAITPNGERVTSGMLYNAAQILEANREWIVQESYSYPTYTYSPTTFNEELTKRDMGLVLDALIYDILRGGNEYSYYAGFGFWVQPANDPYGYIRGDAGHGALIDGAVLDPNCYNRAMLFHSVTFITPAAETLIAKNGVRVEWLNSFTYFANKGMLLTSGDYGFAGQGKTKLRINNRIGTWAPGNTLTYYDTDSTTVLGTGTIDSIDGDYVSLTGKCLGFETITDRTGKTVYAQGGAKLSTAVKKFGTASLALDGTGDYITVATQPDFAFGTDAWCAEAWVYNTVTTGSNQVIFDFRTTDPQYTPTIYIDGATNHLHFSSNGTVYIDTATSLALNTWTHIAVAKSGNSTKFFVNGTQVGTTYTDHNTYVQGAVTIGARYTTTFGFNGYIDDVRISKGAARYTSNFTVPTAALSGDLNTVLLLHFNGANNSTTILDDGITYQDIRTSAGGTAQLINLADYSEFGAEVRSIGSACVYGDYGAYGDGVGVTAYLISHNFAYIGSGELSNNDPNDRIAANEVVELNGAHIYRTSVDNEGNFSVGDSFYVNQKTGDVLFNGTATNITSASGVTFTDGVHTTTITPTDITTGNIRISGNTVESLTGDVNVVSANGNINLQNNTNITGDLDVTGDITIGGNITIGNQSTDTIEFVGRISSDIIPATNDQYNLGAKTPTELRWKNAYLNRVEIDGVVIDNNLIATTVGNDDLVLQANGTGRIYIPTSDVQIDQNLTVNGLVSSDSLEVTTTITADKFAVTDIEITDNYISTTVTNSDLELLANGTGRIYVPSNNVQIDQQLTVDGLTTLGNTNIGTALAPKTLTHIGTLTHTGNVTQTGNYGLTGNLTVQGTTAQFKDIKLLNNLLTTTLTNSDLQIVANGNGKVYIPSNNVLIDQNLTVTTDLTVTTGTTYLKNTSVTGTITQTGDINQTGNFTTSGTTQVTGNITGTGYLQLSNIRLEGNTVSTTVTNSDLQLTANGTGNVIFEGFKFQDNNIQSVVTNSDLIFTPQGTGRVVINSNQSLVIPVGTTGERPLVPSNGMIRFNTTIGRYEGYNNGHWLALSGVQDEDGNTYIKAEAYPGANDNTLYFYADGNLMATIDSTKLFATRLQTSSLDIQNNTITTLATDTDINLTTLGTGGVKVGNLRIHNNTITNVVPGAVTEFVETGSGYIKVAGTNGFVIPSGLTTDRPGVLETGMTRFNTDLQLVEVWNGTIWTGVAGTSSGITVADAEDLGVLTALMLG